MFSVLHICSYIAAVVAFLFVTLSLASGLLYIAELVEEHSRLAKLIGQRTIYFVIILHVLFYAFDSLPLHLTAFGIICHLVYLQNFSKTWPFISLTSIKFISSCLLVILDHFAWFFYFAERARETGAASSGSRRSPSNSYRTGSQWDPNRYGHNSGLGKYAGLRELSFMDVATFFGVCVWLVPFFLFLSLSANDNVLPSLGETTPQIKTTAASEQNSPLVPSSAGFGLGNGSGGQTIPNNLSIRSSSQPIHRSSILKVALDPLLSLVPRIGTPKFRSSRSQRDGLIASPQPSAPPSPSLYGGPTSPAYFPLAQQQQQQQQQQPYSPAVNGTSSYDSTSLSPQTPFNNRFSEHAAIRGAMSSPQLRSPPAPKRSATSPPGASHGFAAAQAQAQVSPSRSPSGFPPGDPNHSPIAPAIQLPPQEDLAIGIARSASPFAGAIPGQSGGGLVSRKKNA